MTRAFISYSHQDETFRAQLDKHMALLKREGLIDLWSDHCIRPGEELDPAIVDALEGADLILLLISADFIHSDYCFSKEMMRAMERHAERTARVVPIILRPCDWHSAPFGKMKSLPMDGKAVTKWPSYDEAYLDIVQQLRKLLVAGPALASSPARERDALPESGEGSSSGSSRQADRAPRMSRSSNLALPRQFTDEERHDFLVSTFEYVRNYFDSSLHELELRNSGFSTRLTVLSPIGFRAIIFRGGSRIAGCYVRIGSGVGSDGIAFSSDENARNNSYNEILAVATDESMLFMRAGMAMFNRGDKNARLTEEGAAEHLWSMLIGNLQQ